MVLGGYRDFFEVVVVFGRAFSPGLEVNADLLSVIDELCHDIGVHLGQDFWHVLVLDEGADCLNRASFYLIGGLLDETVMMGFILEQHSHEIIQVAEILTVSNALWFDDQQALEGVDDLLEDFPMFWGVLNAI